MSFNGSTFAGYIQHRAQEPRCFFFYELEKYLLSPPVFLDFLFFCPFLFACHITMKSRRLKSLATVLFVYQLVQASNREISGHLWWDSTSITRNYLCAWTSRWPHYTDIIMGVMASQSPDLPLFTQPFIQVQIKKNIKVPRHWPLCGEFTGDRWIPHTNGK